MASISPFSGVQVLNNTFRKRARRERQPHRQPSVRGRLAGPNRSQLHVRGAVLLHAGPDVLRRRHGPAYSEFKTGTGKIDLNYKVGSPYPAGSGTRVYDNVADVGFANGSIGTADHKVDPLSVSYINGPLGPTSVYADAFLAPASPGKGAADDLSDDGMLPGDLPPNFADIERSALPWKSLEAFAA